MRGSARGVSTPSGGMRSILVHAYADVDPNRVAQAVRGALEDYGAYVTSVARCLKEHGGAARGPEHRSGQAGVPATGVRGDAVAESGTPRG